MEQAVTDTQNERDELTLSQLIHAQINITGLVIDETKVAQSSMLAPLWLALHIKMRYSKSLTSWYRAS
ncbi:hypothetical protein TUM4630_27580 [Shewanella algidipiscicola]|uniref:Uncharacterized protein n=1 Tax=Shewanella algidipiscicola TaxID=614070 RepID=A0ABQ4PM84_9GAMM|nr:hypothetical protein TUM4630_27580 [Shewanella algidipiscicola]